MKRIIISAIIALTSSLTFNASAQYIHRDKTSFVNDDGVKLTDVELIDIIGKDTFTETVVGARKQYEVGGNLMLGGLVACGSAFMFTLLEWYDTDFGALAITALSYGGGLALDAGIILRIIGKSRLNWIEDYANANYALNVGPTPNGFGISIQF